MPLRGIHGIVTYKYGNLTPIVLVGYPYRTLCLAPPFSRVAPHTHTVCLYSFERDKRRFVRSPSKPAHAYRVRGKRVPDSKHVSYSAGPHARKVLATCHASDGIVVIGRPEHSGGGVDTGKRFARLDVPHMDSAGVP